MVSTSRRKKEKSNAIDTTSSIDTTLTPISARSLDKRVKKSVYYARTSKTKGGGASRRGSHRLADAGGCEVRWYWAYWAKVNSSRGNFYMDFGTLVHTGLAYHYATKMERKPLWYTEQPDVAVQMEADAEGNPSWLRNASELLSAYKRYYDSDPWESLYNEEEWEATLAEVDPEGTDEPAVELEYEGFCTGIDETTNDATPCGHVDDEGSHIAHKTKRVLRLPRLNDELVTCRPDLIVRDHNKIYIIDHKTQGGKKDGSGRLPVIDERHPDYTYYWQALVNLHIVRHGRCAVVDAAKLDVDGFKFNRVKRDIPYDFSRDPFDIPARQYAKIPSTMRAMVRKERQLAIKCATSPKDLVAYPWVCQSKWQCSYARLCHVDTLEARNLILATEFLHT